MRVLGVDGGQSGIRLRHSDGGHVVAVDGVSHQEGDAVAAVADAVARGWRDGAFPPVDRVVLGLTTAPSDAAALDRLGGLVAAATGAPEAWITDDAVTAHAGALSMGWGISLVAGTGVACLALPRSGGARIIGGHGFLLGDEGGGFWIGSRGLGAVLRASDGRGPRTELTARAEERFGPVAGLHVRVHEADRPVNAIAQFAPDVLAAAAAADPVASAIVNDAAGELVGVVAAGIAATDGEGVHGDVPLALGGRLLTPRSELRRRLDAVLGGARLAVAARDADGSALDGALLLGQGPGHRYGPLVHRWPGGAA